jgi:2-dehydropantoate 2-reductase
MANVPANKPSSPKFCIVGAGAVGGAIGAMLAHAGAEVSVLARGRTLTGITCNGLQLIMDGETFHASVKAAADPAELGPQDYVIVAVKAPALPAVATRLQPLIGARTAVVTAMNGVPWWLFSDAGGPLAGHQLKAVDPDGAISRAIPATRVIGCVVNIACAKVAPGVVRHVANRQLLIGEPHRRPTPRLHELVDWLRKAGLDCVESVDIRKDIWSKLCINLSANPISLLTAATCEELVADPLVHDLCVRLMEETARVGEAIGISMTRSIAESIRMVRAVGPVKTSMLQDLEQGKPVEIDAVLTATQEIGRLASVPTPFLDAVLGLARLKASSLGLLESGVRRGQFATAAES